MPDVRATIPALIESLRTEPWDMKTLWVNAFVGRVNTFAKELIHVSRTGKVYVDDKWVIRIRTTFVQRIRLALAYRQQRRVQLDAAWRKATTLPADGKEAAAMFEALQGGSESPRGYRLSPEKIAELQAMWEPIINKLNRTP